MNGDPRAGRQPDSMGRMIYYGKLPGRGDFVRSPVGATVIQTLDHWIAQGLERLAADPTWKSRYDAAPGVDLAFLGTRSPVALAGRLVPSADASQRRFPFVAATSLPVNDPIRLMAVAPLVFASPWQRMTDLMRNALGVEEPAAALDELAGAELAVDPDDSRPVDRLGSYLAEATIADVDRALAAAGHVMSVRRGVLALGLLLQPVLSHAAASLDRALLLPLPEGALADRVAAFWLNLVAPFLARGNFELGLFFVRRPVRPVLLASFNGASPEALETILRDGDSEGYVVDLRNADWVDDYVASDYAIKKLAGYLELGGLSLAQASSTFKESFLGL